MRSLCAVLLAAVFLVGFTVEGDDPEPYSEVDFSTEQILTNDDLSNAANEEGDMLGIGLQTYQGNSASSCTSGGSLSADCSSWTLKCDGNVCCSICEDDGSIGDCDSAIAIQ